jgi:hypothetical protein
VEEFHGEVGAAVVVPVADDPHHLGVRMEPVACASRSKRFTATGSPMRSERITLMATSRPV